MYNKISFEKNSDYFCQSIIFNELKNHLSSDNTTLGKTYFINMIENVDHKINLIIQLSMETIIKHNLSSNMLGGTKGIDPIYFLTEGNSQEVIDNVKPLVYPPRPDRNAPPPTKNEQEMQRANFNLYRSVVDGMIRYMLDKQDLENIDLCENMKEEFAAFIENKYTAKSVNYIKNKP